MSQASGRTSRIIARSSPIKPESCAWPSRGHPARSSPGRGCRDAKARAHPPRSKRSRLRESGNDEISTSRHGARVGRADDPRPGPPCRDESFLRILLSLRQLPMMSSRWRPRPSAPSASPSRSCRRSIAPTIKGVRYPRPPKRDLQANPPFCALLSAACANTDSISGVKRSKRRPRRTARRIAAPPWRPRPAWPIQAERPGRRLNHRTSPAGSARPPPHRKARRLPGMSSGSCARPGQPPCAISDYLCRHTCWSASERRRRSTSRPPNAGHASARCRGDTAAGARVQRLGRGPRHGAMIRVRLNAA